MRTQSWAMKAGVVAPTAATTVTLGACGGGGTAADGAPVKVGFLQGLPGDLLPYAQAVFAGSLAPALPNFSDVVCASCAGGDRR